MTRSVPTLEIIMNSTPPDVDREESFLWLLTHFLLRLFSIGVAATLATGIADAQGTLLYSNAKSGPLMGVGLALGSGQMAGMRFQLSSDAIIDGIGGNLQVNPAPGNGLVFGALVRLTDMNDYPDSITLSTPDVLATTTFSASAGFTDMTTPIGPLTVGPGKYGLVFGSGLFGASGVGSMSILNPNLADSSTFIYSTTYDNWMEYGAAGGLRFTVYGVVVPEPCSQTLALFGASVLCCRRWPFVRLVCTTGAAKLHRLVVTDSRSCISRR